MLSNVQVMCYLMYQPKQPLSKQWKSFPSPEKNSPRKINRKNFSVEGNYSFKKLMYIQEPKASTE